MDMLDRNRPSLGVGDDADVLLARVDVGRGRLAGERLPALDGAAAEEAEAEARPVLDVDADRDGVAARRFSQRAPQRLLGFLKLRSREDRSFFIHER